MFRYREEYLNIKDKTLQIQKIILRNATPDFHIYLKTAQNNHQ